jgi:hypothetical protein
LRVDFIKIWLLAIAEENKVDYGIAAENAQNGPSQTI